MSEQKQGEPDHSKFGYHPKDVEQCGAIKSCICKACKSKREDQK